MKNKYYKTISGWEKAIKSQLDKVGLPIKPISKPYGISGFIGQEVGTIRFWIYAMHIQKCCMKKSRIKR